MDLLYYPGCSLQSSSKLYDIQTNLVLEELGIKLHELEDWNCCGATSAGKTDDFMAIALPARNLGIADACDIEGLVIPCTACYSRMVVAQQRLESDEALLNEINAELVQKVEGKTRILSILEAVLPLIASGELERKVTRKLKGLKPVCYYGCMQTRFPYRLPVPDDVENPQGMETILKVLGIKPLDWNYKTDCCGASAAVNDAETALTLMSRIMKDAIAREADCFVVTCPMCQLNLDAYQKRVGKEFHIPRSLPVYFITELVGYAIGLDLKDLQIDRHFVDAVDLLKELDES